MSEPGGTYWEGGGGSQGANWLRSEGREPGARRKKLAGYWKAANELRQSYQQSYGSTLRGHHEVEEVDDGTPGAFPDAAIIRNGEEEMVLFPSYARRHMKRKPNPRPTTEQDPSGQPSGSGDAEFWREEWEKYEDDHAIVDVDVRGWIYTPHKGPLTRKHRLFVGLARQLVGIPAPTAASIAAAKASPPDSAHSSRAPSPGSHISHRERMRSRFAKQDEEFVSKEAESILRKGEAEAAKAGKGEYSEIPEDDDSGLVPGGSPAMDSWKPLQRSKLIHASSSPSLRDDAGSELSTLKKRSSWNQPANMSQAELQEANSHLMTRLKPFMVNPMADTTISMFFFNEQNSRQKTVMTDAYGHYNVRAALEFIPTHVRILASDRLSATEEVHLIDPRGVSLISDIDDTIKHTAINSGAREIFRNAFIRELGDLTIDGVKEWYSSLAERGVKFHYVSNSPWQLYPILSKFFSLAGLPTGSFHLKQYSGMLQGIFEPVAERKKGTLDRIARDFPERRFILVGDSGEADLEVYTDFVVENPGRVLGVFIRDITTPVSKGFFDSSNSETGGGGRGSVSKQANNEASSLRGRNAQSRIAEVEDDDPDLKAAVAVSLREFEEVERRRFTPSPSTYKSDIPANRPKLPPRRQTIPDIPDAQQPEPAMGKLIDFSDDEAASAPPTPPLPARPRLNNENNLASGGIMNYVSNGKKSVAPPLPRKPVALRTASGFGSIPSPSQPNSKRAPPPPKPRRPSTSIQAAASTPNSFSKLAQPNAQGKPEIPPKPAYSEQQGYISSARSKISSVYNSLPSASSYLHATSQDSNTETDPVERAAAGTNTSKGAPPPPPPRRALVSYPVAAAQSAGSRLNNLYHGNSSATSLSSFNATTRDTARIPTRNDTNVSNISNFSNVSNFSNASGTQPLNKKEELWRRRWERAQQILGDKGITLKRWRVGSDGMQECIELVDKALKEDRNYGEGL